MLIKANYFSTLNWIQLRNSCANLVLFHELWNKFKIPGWRLLGLFGSGKFRIKIGSDTAWPGLSTALKRRPWKIFVSHSQLLEAREMFWKSPEKNRDGREEFRILRRENLLFWSFRFRRRKSLRNGQRLLRYFPNLRQLRDQHLRRPKI